MFFIMLAEPDPSYSDLIKKRLNSSTFVILLFPAKTAQINFSIREINSVLLDLLLDLQAILDFHSSLTGLTFPHSFERTHSIACTKSV